MDQTRSILFVCTGNTCRSPMAEEIARDLLSRRPIDEPPVRVRSAGATAVDGDPVSEEAKIAVESLGIPFRKRQSIALSFPIIVDSDVIYAMTRSHAWAVLSIDPTAEAKVRLLDPDGEDVPDPIGAPQNVYTETARLIRDLIARRIKEQCL